MGADPLGRVGSSLAGSAAAPVLTVEGLKKHFPIRSTVLRRSIGAVRAVDGVSFTVERGETLGMVGESGSGKSTVGRTVLRLEEPTEGSVRFDGVDLAGVPRGELRRLRTKMQMVF
ncbi:MAG: ATP-binding cassette domain-containing protein, partial [Actinomycetota bacterium]